MSKLTGATSPARNISYLLMKSEKRVKIASPITGKVTNSRLEIPKSRSLESEPVMLRSFVNG
jgi:hypothetical protein